MTEKHEWLAVTIARGKPHIVATAETEMALVAPAENYAKQFPGRPVMIYQLVGIGAAQTSMTWQ